MTETIPDQSSRLRALDHTSSFIVQAPAGSGKTELLTQRYLVLLGHAQAPEEIIAITFTRKAAAEMRSRILAALQQATQARPELPHAQKTWELAQQALQRDHLLEWHLLANPNRLRILTIDSLCSSLARQMPVLSGLGGSVTISEDPFPLYEHAARKLLLSLESDVAWSQALDTLLLHVDNDHGKAERLLVDMLAKRDQWLPYLSASRDARHVFEYALENVLLENIEKVAVTLPANSKDELLELVKFAASNITEDSDEGPIRSCQALYDLPPVSFEGHQQWLGIATLLLTQTKQWRKTLNQNLGFPAPSSCKDKTQKVLFESMKRRMGQLLERLSILEPLRLALEDLLNSPPIHFKDSQWAIIESQLELLPILVAHLKIEFQLHGAVDYIEIANSALMALGAPEEPTDLALALDYKIQHILIDEFQDTSSNQYRLLEQLTAGWQAGDGRTLFLVGDPMQSIYRFRKAEVGLFLRAREIGIGNIYLEPLTLSVNFRSHRNIVDWINTTFSTLLPEVEDIATGAVAYHPSVAIHTEDKPAKVSTYPFYTVSFALEAQQVVAIIQQTLTENPEASIAILVRAKTHLSDILPALQAANIHYKAVDIDPLSSRQVIQDLLALTQALLHFGDRTAWLALLRAPWCGLTLNDMHTIVARDHQAAVWEQLQAYERLALPSESKQRVAKLVSLLSKRIALRRQMSLRLWLEGTWLALGGPACLSNATDLEDAQTFFELIDELAEGGDIADFEQLYSRLQKLYASPNTQYPSHVEIMSIHKAKGLEFDTVILPGLGRELPSDDPQLLLWMERPKRHGGTDLLVAPMRAAHEEFDPIYNYLRSEEAKKTYFETGRLLYVAATRAKQHLHLLGHCLTDTMTQPPTLLKPAKRSLLAQLWPQIESSFQLKINHAVTLDTPEFSINDDSDNIKRLPLSWNINNALTTTLAKYPAFTNTQIIFNELTLPYPYQQIHQVLSKTLAKLYQQNLNKEQFESYFSHALQQAGLKQPDLNFCLHYIQHIVQTVKEDAHAKWLFASSNDGQTNFIISSIDPNKVSHYRIDWIFSDKQHWLILYNFMSPEKSDIPSFIRNERQRYQPYLEAITKAVSVNLKDYKMGIYFPMIKHFEQA